MNKSVSRSCRICHRELRGKRTRICGRKECRKADNRRRQREWSLRQKVSAA